MGLISCFHKGFQCILDYITKGIPKKSKKSNLVTNLASKSGCLTWKHLSPSASVFSTFQLMKKAALCSRVRPQHLSLTSDERRSCSKLRWRIPEGLPVWRLGSRLQLQSPLPTVNSAPVACSGDRTHTYRTDLLLTCNKSKLYAYLDCNCHISSPACPLLSHCSL